MLTGIMLIYIGIAVGAPVWYFWGGGAIIAISFIQFAVKTYTLGKK